VLFPQQKDFLENLKQVAETIFLENLVQPRWGWLDLLASRAMESEVPSSDSDSDSG